MQQPSPNEPTNATEIGPTVIRYDWPAGGLDPFTLDSPHQTLWILIGGFDWGRAWPAGDVRDFASDRNFARRVQMGRLAISIYERLALSYAGRLLQRWPQTGDPDPSLGPVNTDRDQYQILQQTPGATRVGPPFRFRTAEDAIERMLAAAVRPQMPLMVARCLYSTSWW